MSYFSYLISAKHHTYKEFESEEKATELTEAYLHTVPDTERESLLVVFSRTLLVDEDIRDLQEQLLAIANSVLTEDNLRFFI